MGLEEIAKKCLNEKFEKTDDLKKAAVAVFSHNEKKDEFFLIHNSFYNNVSGYLIKEGFEIKKEIRTLYSNDFMAPHKPYESYQLYSKKDESEELPWKNALMPSNKEIKDYFKN